MKIFRTIIETEEIGEFLADAIHDQGRISSLAIYPIKDGIVGPAYEYGLEQLPDIVKQIEQVLTEI